MFDRLRQHPLATSLLLGGLIGALVGLLRPLAPAASMHAPTNVEWALPAPSVVSRFDDKQFAAVTQRNPFGAAGAASGAGSGAAEGARRWRLTGIILEPTATALVLADGANEVSRVAIGDALPDGGVLSGVDVGGVDYRRDGCRWRRVLYAAEGAADESHCEDTEPPPDQSAG